MKPPGQHGAHHGAGVGELHPLAHAVRAAAPSGVHQPDVGVVLMQQRAEHLGVLGGMPDEEDGAEACRERGLRFRDAALGARDLRGVPGEEVIHRLLPGELGDRRQHAEGVGRQEDDVPGVPAASARHVVADVRQRVRRARVLGDALVLELHLPAVGIEHDVLEDRAEHLRGPVDVGLALRREVDDLGVAAPLEVERAFAAPAVLVVADEPARRVGRQRRLAGAGEAKEERRVARLPDVGRAVHGEHAGLGKQVIHDREHRLLELARVARAADDDGARGEVQHDEGAGARAVPRRVGLELGGVVHHEVRRERGEVLLVGTNEHVADERRVPRVGQDVADAQAVGRVGAAEEVLHEELREPVQVHLHVGEEQGEVRRGHRLVDRAPVHVAFRVRLPDDELVVGRAARMRRGDGHERPQVGQPALTAADCRLDEFGRDVIPVHRPGGREILVGETQNSGSGHRGRTGGCIRHCGSSRSRPHDDLAS